MRASRLSMVPRLEAEHASTIGHPSVGRLVELSALGPLVATAARAEPILARTTVPVSSLRGCEGRDVLVLFLDGDVAKPVIVGLLQPCETTPVAAVPQGGALEGEARVDGRRVVIRGAESVVLQCGESSLELRKDGEVVLRGVRVETRARRLHRIRGGTVRIN